MLFFGFGFAAIPLMDRAAQLAWTREDVSTSQILLTMLVGVFGGALLWLGQKVRRTIHELQSEKSQLQSLFESLAEGVVIHGADGTIVQFNPQAERILGLSADKLIGLHPQDVLWNAVHEDGTPWLGTEHPAMVTLRTGQPIRQAVMGIRLPSGDQRWLSINTQAIALTKGQTTQVIASFTDITDTRQQLDRLDLTITGAGLGTWDWNVLTGQVVFNDVWAHMLGYELSEVEPNVRSWERIVDREAAGEVMRKLNDHLEGRTSDYRSEHRLKRKDGSWIWVLDTGRVVERDSGGKPLRALGVHVDITLTKQMEQQMRESDRRFLTIFDQTFHLLWVLTPEGIIDNANQTALRFAGSSLTEVVGRAFWESPWLLNTGGQQEALRSAIVCAARGHTLRFELEVHSSRSARSGSYITCNATDSSGLSDASVSTVQRCIFDFSLKPVMDESNRVTSIVAEALDITDAMQTRETLREAEDRLNNATQNANLGVWDWNPQTDVAWFSDRWFSMLGYQPGELPSAGSTWSMLLHPADKEHVNEMLGRHLEGDLSQTQSEFRLEFRMRTKDGKWRWILSVGRVTQRDEQGRPTRVSGVHFDETERKNQQSQRAQAQRLESIGQLAAGVAHEINTPMQFVSDNLEYLVEGLDAAERVIQSVQEHWTSDERSLAQVENDLRGWLQRTLRETGYERFRRESAGAVHDCRDGCQRVVTIVHAMRQLSHPGTTGFHSADLNDVINGATIVTRNHWKFVADVRLEFDPDLRMVPCRAAELSQVFVNMLVNSADAMAESSNASGSLQGAIVIRTQMLENSVQITVQDNGSGIPAAVVDKIFDPFFTTKPVGKGTGQGLAIAHDIIVNRHNGVLKVDSELGRGTTFTIELPLFQPEPDESVATW